MYRKSHLTTLSYLLLTLGNSWVVAQQLPLAVNREVDFAREVQPLLTKHCAECHGAKKQESGFRVDRRDAALLGGDSGAAITVGKSSESKLIHLVAALDPDKAMPPDGPRLSEEAIGVLRAWIDAGAKWPDSHSGETSSNRHWAYQSLRLVPPPQVNRTDWPVNAIDRFVLAKLESRGISPSEPADRYTLIRRLSLDLTGLLPSIADVDAFVNDTRPEAYELNVDRLLESPHFGERWGRHWLDMARYADSDGYEKDNPRPDAYRYRDWVIDAINSDMPFDQFTIEQLAGDLLPGATDMQRLATAFHRQTLTNTEGGTDQEQFRVEACFDRTETTGAVWLGLTVGCARCHTHKYDAITQREYYQLFAFFNNGDEQTHVVPKSHDEVVAYQSAKAQHDAELSEVTRKLKERQSQLGSAQAEWEEHARRLREDAKANPLQLKLSLQSGFTKSIPLPENVAQALVIPTDERSEAQRGDLLEYFSTLDPQAKSLVESLAKILKKAPPKPEISVRVLSQRTKEPRSTYVLRRGEFLEPIVESAVEPSGLETLPPLQSRVTGQRADRLDFARWLVSKENPITPRVTVNHVWRLLFGNGIVKTSNDFGVRGDAPTHPELLDWLSANFIGLTTDSNLEVKAWSRKSLIKLIVMSATYRQSSSQRSDLVDIDPQNQLLAKQNRLRVEGEIVRDISLDAAGLLSRRIGGPSVFPLLPPGVAELSYAGNFKWTLSEGAERYRRGMYTFFKRTSPHPNLITFDCPDANLTCVDRNRSNTPLQALISLNNDSFAEAARGLAKRALELNCNNASERVETVFRLCLARSPNEFEKQQLLALLEDSQKWYAKHTEDAKRLIEKTAVDGCESSEIAAWVATARILINLDEFITRE